MDFPNNRRPVIGFFADSVGAGLATLVKVLADAPGNVVLFARKDIGRRLIDHESIFPFLEDFQGIELHDPDKSVAFEFDVLFVTWSHSVCFRKEDREILKRILPAAKKRVLLYDGQFGSRRDMLKQQIRTLCRELSLLRQMDEICYMTVYPERDFFSFFRRRYPLSVGPHVDLLFDSEHLTQFFSHWNPKEQRRFALSCSGNKATSIWRAELVDHLEGVIRQIPDVSLVENESGRGARKVVVWSVNGRRLDLPTYVDFLSNSDFILCIPGTSWTHRPFESLARGAIPIVDEDNLRVHDIPWVDGQNCLIVRKPRRKESWEAAVRRALALGQYDIIQMREHIYALRSDWLLPASFAARLRSKLGYSTQASVQEPALALT